MKNIANFGVFLIVFIYIFFYTKKVDQKSTTKTTLIQVVFSDVLNHLVFYFQLRLLF